MRVYSRLSGVAGLLLMACGGSAPTPPPPAPAVAKPKKAAEPVVSPAPEADQARLAYTYNPIGKRDPFRSQFVDALRSEKATGDAPCGDPLCRFDVDDLALVAVVTGDANPLAMVEDKNRVGYVVRRLSKIGKNGGKVTSILRECIQVTSYPQVGADARKQAVVVEKCVKVDPRAAAPNFLTKGE